MSELEEQEFTAQVITVSSRCASGAREDRSGPLLAEKLAGFGFVIDGIDLIPDCRLSIQQAVLQYADITPVSLVAFAGGTGPTPDDLTPDALLPLLDREFRGLANAIQHDARSAVPKAPLSRVVVGVRSGTVILALPGSPGGVADAMASLEPVLPHFLALVTGRPDPH